MEAEGNTTKSLQTIAFNEGLRLSGDSNICAVGHGIKLRDGKPQGSDCIVYFVREKLAAASDLRERGTWPVPAQVDGYETDVVEVGTLSVATADRAVPVGRRGTRIDDPLIGGVATMALGATSAGPGCYGTLGGLCFNSSTGTPHLLSNAHVWGQTVNTEVVQPIAATAVFGAAATPAVTPSSLLVRTRIPTALVAPVVFANSLAQTTLITGGDSDPQVVGQGATSVTPTTRTDAEQITVAGPNVDLPPAGRRISPSVAWNYSRISNTAVLAASSNAPRAHSKLLAARRLFTDATSYALSGGATIRLYAEIIPAAGGAPAVASSHFPTVFLYPLVAGDRVVARVLRPTTRQTPTTITSSFAGFPAPARVGPASLPVTVSGFGVDCDLPGAFQTPPSGTLPAGMQVLKLPAATVRLFVPPSTQVVIDIDLRGSTGPLQVTALNSAGDSVGTITTAAGTAGRTNITAAASEILELQLSGVTNALLFGVTSRRASPESTAPLCYSGTVTVASLSRTRWGASLFVQELDSGIPESANVIEIAIGAPALISDCTFDVT